MPYAAPIADMRFALEACAGLWSLRERYPDLDADVLVAILDGAGALAADTLAPINRPADRAGVRLKHDGAVASAPGFREAYEAFKHGGWQGLAADPAYGGQGLPRAVALAVMETMHSANMSFALLPMLTLGAIEAIEQHGAPDQKALYLEKLICGEWSGTMNLTEPQAGSDLGALTTKALPQPNGSYAITGQKIFITWGEHDLAANIIHLVLARIEGAPAGSKGISMFIVPKVLEDGSRNGVGCIGIEEKMGIHASPTCTLAYEGATGWLIGEENRGLAAMFTMMNAARLNVGMQGIGVAEAAYQKALAYAKERKQGGALIIEHPDVRRMLMTMKAKVQAGRATCYATAVAADIGDKAREDLLTPIAKAWCTDLAVEAASLGVQVHGGMGYVEEGGAAQFYRDARIAPIYEGTNGIQAIDLFGRKLLGDRGEAMGQLIEEARAIGHPQLTLAADALREATDYMLAAPREDALAGASAYLALAGDVAGGAFLARGLARASALAAMSKTLVDEQSTLFGYYAGSVLARAVSRLAEIKIGARTLFDPKLSDFAG
jgi:alkylation response protein AidB-like acyl-CoA dehydrogenase